MLSSRLGNSEVTLATAHSRATAEYGKQFGVWCYSPRKRAFDFCCALILLLLALPVLLAIAAIVKITSQGPVLFRQSRVGRNGRLFTVLKFRTMALTRRDPGAAITEFNDPRITGVGGILRRWKLDELPQLINVVAGDMSLVGPRPDLPEFYQTLENRYREILLQRPGMTGMASLKFRNEEKLFAGLSAEESLKFYQSTLLPEKVALDLEYARAATFISDIRLIVQTLRLCSISRGCPDPHRIPPPGQTLSSRQVPDEELRTAGPRVSHT